MRARNATAAIIEQMKLLKAVKRSLAQQGGCRGNSFRGSPGGEGVSSGEAEASAPIAPALQRGGASSEQGSIVRDLEAPRISADSPNSRTPGTPEQKEVMSKQGRAKTTSSRRK